jgi:hypothetical protein
MGPQKLDYQESEDRAKMTYSRIDLMQRGPSCTHLEQNAAPSCGPPSHCKRTAPSCCPVFRAHSTITLRAVRPAIESCTLRMLHGRTEYEDCWRRLLRWRQSHCKRPPWIHERATAQAHDRSASWQPCRARKRWCTTALSTRISMLVADHATRGRSIHASSARR